MYKAKVTRPDFDNDDKIVTLTATIESGTSKQIREFKVLVKKNAVTDSQAVVLDLTKILLPASTKTDLILPLLGENGSTISWKSNSESIISNLGYISRPNSGAAESSVTMNATTKKNNATQSQVFTVKVLPWTKSEELSDAASKIVWDLIRGENVDQLSIEKDIVLPAKAGRDIPVVWDSPTTCLDKATGKITFPAFKEGDVTLRLTATLTVDGESKVVNLGPYTISALPMTNQDIIDKVSDELITSLFLGENTSLNNVTKNMTLPIKMTSTDLARASIVWSLAKKQTNGTFLDVTTSPNVSIIQHTENVEAIITRPSTVEGNTLIALKATIKAGDNTNGGEKTTVKYFDLVIVAQ